MKHLSVPQSHSLAIAQIQEFFDAWSLHTALKKTDMLFNKAMSNKAWRLPNPYDAVQYCRRLQQLSKAAYLLSGSFAEAYAQSIIAEHTDGVPDLLKQENFSGCSRKEDAFSNFPRQLGKDEYCYPSRAIGRYCRFRTKKGWKKFFRRLLLCALSGSSLLEYKDAGQLFALRRQVHKLVEACHLIHVRLGNVQVVVE